MLFVARPIFELNEIQWASDTEKQEVETFCKGNFQCTLDYAVTQVGSITNWFRIRIRIRHVCIRSLHE